MSKEAFKSFARLHPELAENVLKDKITWQKLYELYDIYGENSSVWNKYFTKEISSDSKIGDIVDTIKKIDMKTVQNSIESKKKAVGLLEGLALSNTKGNIPKTTYEKRPMYKYFED